MILRFNMNIKKTNLIIEKSNTVELFLIILGLYTIVTQLTLHFIRTVESIHFTFGHLPVEQREQIIKTMNSFSWLPFVFNTLYLTFILFYNSFFIYMGLKIFEIDLSIKKIYRIVLISELIFVIQKFVALILLSSNEVNNLILVDYYSPLSLLSLFPEKDLNSLFGIAAGGVNIFLVAYILTVSFLISKVTELKFYKAFYIAILFYGLGYSIQILFKIIMFNFQ